MKFIAEPATRARSSARAVAGAAADLEYLIAQRMPERVNFSYRDIARRPVTGQDAHEMPPPEVSLLVTVDAAFCVAASRAARSHLKPSPSTRQLYG